MQPTHIPKVNYLNNKDILDEIYKSKLTFSSFTDPIYKEYDLIVPSLSAITAESLVAARANKGKRLTQRAFESKRVQGIKVKLSECEFDTSSILDTDLVFRVMTYDHIPSNLTRKKTLKTTADHHDKVNFPPFQHWKYDESMKLVCVGKSHWIGDVETGHFSKDHGQITNTLARMYIKLCERYATRGNVRGYCVDTETEALTTRGWLNINTITEDDTILSYTNNVLTWSKIKSIYRGDYNGAMHYLTSRSIDSLITPEHKLVTARGLVKVEVVTQSDQIIVLGDAVAAPSEQLYPDTLVELLGYIVTGGHYQVDDDGQVSNISV